MSLKEFDVSSQQLSDEETEEVLRPGDPHRSLIRYQPDGGELYIHARVNMALLRRRWSCPFFCSSRCRAPTS